MNPYYEDGVCTIYHGDCREILPSVEGDIVLTDPPYSVSVAGVAHVGSPGTGTRSLDFFDGDSDWRVMTDVATTGVLAAAERVRGGVLYAWCGHRQFGAIVAGLEERNWATRFVVWAKKYPPPSPPNTGRWPSGAELCIYATREGWVWNPPTEPRSNVLTFDGYRHGQPGKVDHPTQKPLALFAQLIGTSTLAGQTVLDPFVGSGTTLRAAKDLGRKAIGIEIEERYCAIAAERLSQEVLDFGGAP